MTPHTSRIVLPLLVGASLALTACGGDDNGGSASGSKTSDVKQVATSVITDGQKSCSLLTDHALGTFTGGKKGAAGRKQCLAQVAKGKLPKRANVVVLEVKGANASVGYTTDQVTGTMELVKQGGGWKMDQITTVTKR